MSTKTKYVIDGHSGYQVFSVGKKASGALLDGREWREMPKGGRYTMLGVKITPKPVCSVCGEQLNTPALVTYCLIIAGEAELIYYVCPSCTVYKADELENDKTLGTWMLGGHNWRKVSASTRREITNKCRQYGLEKPNWKKKPNANKLVTDIVARFEEGKPGD